MGLSPRNCLFSYLQTYVGVRAVRPKPHPTPNAENRKPNPPQMTLCSKKNWFKVRENRFLTHPPPGDDQKPVKRTTRMLANFYKYKTNPLALPSHITHTIFPLFTLISIFLNRPPPRVLVVSDKRSRFDFSATTVYTSCTRLKKKIACYKIMHS